MNIPWFIFALLLALCVILCIAFVTPQGPFGDVEQDDGTMQSESLNHGYAHDKYVSMKQGGPGAERAESTLWVAWAFGVVQIVFFVACLLLGASRHGKLGPAKIPFAIGTVIHVCILSALYLSYRGFLDEDTHELFLSFPKPTAWMIYGIWPFPIFFLIVYYVQFDKWHFTDEDQKNLDELLASRPKETSGDH
jgi:hypothetical protein